jgi:hypothetical protein
MDPVPEASDACASTYVAPEPTVINLGEQLQCEPAPAPEPGKRATGHVQDDRSYSHFLS